MSNVPSWYDLLPDHPAIQQMDPAQLEKASRMAEGEISTLAFGISGLGNILACAASNEDSGLSSDAVESIGWMLESVGRLIANLSDTQGAMQHRLDALSRTSKPANGS